jgi:hypothetical protein
MVSGIYLVNFLANNSLVGEGLVVIRNSSVNGGDQTYLYQGRFDYYGDDIKALIEVQHYRGPLNSVLGALKQYTLSLSGKKSGGNFEVSGGIPNISNLQIKITGTKVADLFE